MLTDSIRLMYCTFQSARQAHPAVSELLPLLEKVLDTVIREPSFVVEIPDVWVNPFDAYVPGDSCHVRRATYSLLDLVGNRSAVFPRAHGYRRTTATRDDMS